MQKAISTFLFFSFLLLTLSLDAIAQPVWKWGRNGGSQINNFNDNTEFVYDMASDKHGNIYVIAKVYADELHVDGTPVAGQGEKDVLLTSFKCDGSYRWSVVIGGDEFDDVASAVKTDTLGGVYVCGNVTMLTGTPGHFGDTMVDNTVKSLYLVKFDTNGVYQWLRMPQADSVDVSAHLSTAVDMDVTPDGEIRMLASLTPGAYENGAYVVNNTGMHILEYDAAGTYQGGMEMDMNLTMGSLYFTKMVRDHATGRYYLSGTGYTGWGSVFIGGVFVTPSMYVASFDQQGLHLWTQTGTLDDNSLSGFFGRPQLDDSGFVYVSGYIEQGELFGNTYTATNSFGTAGIPLAFITKLDSNANVVWATNVHSTGEVDRCFSALMNNDEVVLAGSYHAELEWPGYAGPHPHHGMLSNSDVFMTRFNTHTGEVIKVDTLTSDAFSYEPVTAIAPDGIGGIVIGGWYTSSLYIAGDSLAITGGTEPEFFVARYAENCDLPQSVATHESAASVMVYPNPVSGELMVSGDVTLKHVTITNSVGAVVRFVDCTRKKEVVDVSMLSTGLYFVKVTDVNGGVSVVKVVKL